MDDMDNKLEFDESAENEDSTLVLQNKNIIEEMKNLEQHMNDPKNQTFKKTTYWNQLNNTKENINNESLLLKEIIECLLSIEGKLTQIENLLEK